jgi:DNA-3-methyladenine glycosylase
MASKILMRAYFNRPTLEVAKGLLGKYLVRSTDTGSLAGRIADVEAYVGPEDLACHASKGRTKRTDVLFGPPGTAYVYFIYGMHYCFNVVTEQEGYPAAVLIRAVDLSVSPVETNGIGKSPEALINGPGRVCRALSIDLELNRWDLTVGRKLWIEDRGERTPTSHVIASPRIGVDYAGEWAAKPWRFVLSYHARRPTKRAIREYRRPNRQSKQKKRQ